MKFARITFLLPVISILLISCGGNGSGPNGSLLNSLEGSWTLTCKIDQSRPDNSTRHELAFRSNEVYSLETLFYGTTNCSSTADKLFIAVSGTYIVSDNNTSLAGQQLSQIDVQFSNGSYSGSEELINTLASQGTTLEDIFAADGIPRLDNLPATQFFANPNFRIVFTQLGNTLRIGLEDGGITETAFDGTYIRNGGQATTADSNGSQNALPAATQVPGLSGFWYTGYIARDNSVTYRNFLTFDDGETTYDTAGVMSNGRVWSQQNGGKWASYRILSSGKLQFFDSDGIVYTTSFSTKTRSVGSDQRYDGCWVSRRSAALGSSLNGGAYGITFSSRTYCFNTAGQYNTVGSSAFSTAGPNGSGGAGSASPGESGIYRIDGHVITLQTNTGDTVRTSFGITPGLSAGDPDRMVIGQGVYVESN